LAYSAIPAVFDDWYSFGVSPGVPSDVSAGVAASVEVLSGEELLSEEPPDELPAVSLVGAAFVADAPAAGTVEPDDPDDPVALLVVEGDDGAFADVGAVPTSWLGLPIAFASADEDVTSTPGAPALAALPYAGWLDPTTDEPVEWLLADV
jgi:hypothetical protein